MRGGTGIVIKAVPRSYEICVSSEQSDNISSYLQYKVWCTDLNEKLWFSEEDLVLLARVPANPIS